MYVIFRFHQYYNHLANLIYSLRKSSSAKGTATLNDPNDPNRPGELIVNFGGFQRK